MNVMPLFRYLFVLLLMLTFSPVVQSAELETDSYSMTVFPSTPSFGSNIQLHIDVHGCVVYRERKITIDNEADTVHVSLVANSLDFSISCIAPEHQIIPVGNLSGVTDYQFFVYTEEDDDGPDFYQEENLDGTFTVSVNYWSDGYYHETPAESSVQSGIGLIRGWACDAYLVEIAIDDGERIPVAYGTTREDTVSECGDANNGYGMVVNWGALSAGSHTLSLYIDRSKVSDTTFTVSGMDEEYAVGLSGTYTLQDFPQDGSYVVIEWSEAQQNFIITEQGTN